jgi:hypothetical protein
MQFAIKGTSGRLLVGSRTAAQLNDWQAEPAAEHELRVRAPHAEIDPFWMANHGGRLMAALDFGRKGIRGPAIIESDNPLVVVVTYEE